MAEGRVEGIQISGGGVPKRPVPAAAISAEGLAGDWQRDRRHHGGPERAVSLFSAEVIAALAAEGHPIAAGTTGENLTVSGLPWAEVRPGVEVRVGPVRLLVTGYAAPCRAIAGSFTDGRFGRLAEGSGRCRVYARVLEPGTVRLGDPVALVRLPGASG